MQDLIFTSDVEQVMASTNLTASKTNMNVIDLGAAGILAGPVNECMILVGVDAISTADTSNYFTLDLYHAAAKTSSTALTAGVKVTSANGLLNADSPVINATTLTTQAQKCILIGYRGILRYLQLQPTETGTADITISVYAIYSALDSKHSTKLA